MAEILQFQTDEYMDDIEETIRSVYEEASCDDPEKLEAALGLLPGIRGMRKAAGISDVRMIPRSGLLRFFSQDYVFENDDSPLAIFIAEKEGEYFLLFIQWTDEDYEFPSAMALSMLKWSNRALHILAGPGRWSELPFNPEPFDPEEKEFFTNERFRGAGCFDLAMMVEGVTADESSREDYLKLYDEYSDAVNFVNAFGKKCKLMRYPDDDFLGVVPINPENGQTCMNGTIYQAEEDGRYRVVLSAQIPLSIPFPEECPDDFFFKTDLILNPSEVAELIDSSDPRRFRLIFGRDSEFSPDYAVCFNTSRALEDLKPFMVSEDPSVSRSAKAFADFVRTLPAGLSAEDLEEDFGDVF